MEEFPLVPEQRQSPSKTKCRPSPPVEKVKDRTSSPPPTEKDNHTTPVQPFEDYTMPYPYSKYREDPDVEAHVYVFLQKWEANHVSERLTKPEAE